MSEPFIGMILPFPYVFTPVGWSSCQGQLLNINQNTTLFSLIGNKYGGDNIRTFGLPELRGRSIIGAGQRDGASEYTLGNYYGNETYTLLTAQMPAHSHTATFTGTGGGSSTPLSVTVSVSQDKSNNVADPDATHRYLGPVVPGGPDISTMWTNTLTTPVNLAGVTVSGGGGGITGGTVAVGVSGGSQPFSLMNPSLALNFCMAVSGLYPERPS